MKTLIFLTLLGPVALANPIEDWAIEVVENYPRPAFEPGQSVDDWCYEQMRTSLDVRLTQACGIYRSVQ